MSCDCELCNVADELTKIQISLSLYLSGKSSSLASCYKYTNLDKEIAYQKGLFAGYAFRLNEMSGDKVIKTVSLKKKE